MITDPRIGTELAGYRIDSQLGRGGMGVVYLATHTRLRRRAVLKLLAPELLEAPGFRDRFLRESEIAASLEHPSIVPVYDAGEEDGVLYLAMRYIEGTDLKRLLVERGLLEPTEALRIMDPVAHALDAAHSRGLVHRDVKPANVLVDVSGHAYLSDFGLTKRLSSDSGLTGTGQFVGTLDYAAPEQFEGKQLDARTDVYSLGCLLYECLTGKVPFARDQDVALMYAHLNSPPPEVTQHRPELPKEIDRVVVKAMAKAPGDRYPSAGGLVEAARQALGPAIAPVAPAPSRPPEPSGLRRWLLVGGALAIVLAVVVGVVLAGQRGGTPGSSPSPSPTGVPLAAADRVVRITQAGSQAALAQLAPIEAGKDPRAVVVGEGSIWVANQSDGTVSRIDPVTNEAEAVIEVGRRPVAIAFGEGSVWVVNRLNRSVSRIDPSRNQVIATIDLETTRSPSSIAVAEGAVWVAVDSDWPGPHPPEIHRIDSGSNRDVATIVGKDAVWEVIAAGEGAAWAADNSGRVFRIDLRTNERFEVANLRVPAGAITIADGSLWFSTVNGEVLRIDPDTGQIQARMPGGGALVNCSQNCSSEVSTVGMAAGDGIIWVTDKVNGSVSRIIAASNTTLEPIKVGQTPTGVTVGYGSVWVTVDASL